MAEMNQTTRQDDLPAERPRQGFRHRISEVLLRRRLSDLDRSFAAGSLGALAIRVVGTGLLLLLQIVLTRVMGPEEFGDYLYALSWVNVLAAVAVCGMDTASLRFVAAYVGTGEWDLLRGYLRVSARIVFLGSVGLSCVMAAIVVALRAHLADGLKTTLLAASLLLPAATFLLLVAALLRGFQHIMVAMMPQFVVRPLLVGLSVWTVYRIVSRPPAAVEVMGLEIVVASALLAAMISILRRKLPEGLRNSGVIRENTSLWWATGLPLMAITGIRMAMNKVDILVVGLLLDTKAAGVYAIGAQVATLISFGLFAVNMIAAPIIAQLYAQERREELQRIVRLGALATFAFSTATGTFLVLLGKPILGLFGPAFVAAYTPLQILVFSQVANSLAGSVGYIMTMTAHEGEAARVTAWTGVLNVALAFLLIPRFGLLGAAAATALAGIAWNAVLVSLVWRRVAINPTVFRLRP